MKLITLVLVLVGCVTAQAKDMTLICMMGDGADMDIEVTMLANKKEKITVVLMSADGESKTKFMNSGFVNSSLSNSLVTGKLDVIVSESDLNESFGGAFIDAGMLTMQLQKDTGRYDVLFAAKGIVYTASCK